MTKLGLRVAALLWLAVAAASNVTAGVMSAPGGFEVSYRMELYSGTTTGEDIKDVFIFEWDATSSSVDGTFSIAANGPTTLSHVIGFAPTSALVIGYLDAKPGVGDEKRHIYTLFNPAYHDYLVANFSGYKFSELFGQGEQATIDLIIAAAGGDSAALTSLENFVQTNMAGGAFDPNGAFTILRWSPLPEEPEGGSIPVPSTSALLLLGLLAMQRRITA